MTDAFTPERIAQLRARTFDPDLPAALDEIERLREANEELEQNAEIVSADFEKDCWRAVRKLLEITGYDFTDEGVTADESFEHIAEEIRGGNTQLKLISAERDKASTALAKAQARIVELEVALMPFCYMQTNMTSGEEDDDGISVFDDLTAGDVRRARAALKGEG